MKRRPKTITSSPCRFRPQGRFAGTPGQEQFFIEKEGRVAHRQVLSLPERKGRRGLLLVALVVTVIGGGAGVAGVLFLSGGDEGQARVTAPATSTGPTSTALSPAAALVPAPAPTPTAVAAAAPAPTAARAAKQEKETVQTAIDIYIVDNSLPALPGGDVPNVATNIFGSGGTLDLSAAMRKPTTTYYYCWDRTGKVIAQLEDPQECSSAGPTPTAKQENETIQTAIDTYLANNSLSALPGDVPNVATNIFGSGGTLDLSAAMRKPTTTYYYCWDRTGKITVQLPSPEECP